MLAYGVEAGTQGTLDRLEKRQTLAQVEHAVGQAKEHGIARVHGFFVIGCPGETAADIRETFRFAARLALDTFGFNRLAVYRGTPLWKEYVGRGIIDEDRDWDKTFKCCDIDPDTVPNDEVNGLRMKGYASLLLRRILLRPIRTWDLLRTFSPAHGLERPAQAPLRPVPREAGGHVRPAGEDGRRGPARAGAGAGEAGCLELRSTPGTSATATSATRQRWRLRGTDAGRGRCGLNPWAGERSAGTASGRASHRGTACGPPRRSRSRR